MMVQIMNGLNDVRGQFDTDEVILQLEGFKYRIRDDSENGSILTVQKVDDGPYVPMVIQPLSGNMIALMRMEDS